MSISLLYVDDEEPLRDIAERFLSADPDMKVLCISSAEHALSILTSTAFDIIVTDYQMPVMDGLEFLSELSARGITIPVILFTGRGREEVAIEAYNRGATFYVQKGTPITVQFSELIHKIRIAVDRDRTRKAHQESEQRFRSFFTHSLMGNAILDADKRIIEVNDQLCRILGRSRDELIGTYWPDYTLPDKIQGKEAEVQGLRNDSDSDQIHCLKKDRTTIETRIALSPLYEEGRVTGYSLLLNDISTEIAAGNERRMNELRLTILHDLYKQQDTSRESIFRFMLTRFLEITGSQGGFFMSGKPERSEMTIYTLSPENTLGIIEVRSENLPFLCQNVAQDKHQVFEYPPDDPLRLPDIFPETDIIRLLCVPCSESETDILISCSFNKEQQYSEEEAKQITLILHDSYEFLTRTQAEKELRTQYKELVESWNLVAEHENSTRTLLNALEESGLLIDPDGKILDFNRKAAEFFKIPDTASVPSLCTLLPGPAGCSIQAGIQNALETGTDQRVSAAWDNRTYEWSINPIKGFKQKCGRLVLFCRDVTRMKEIEDELEQSRERYRQFTEFLPQSLFEIDQDGKVVYINPHGRSTFCISGEEVEKGIPYPEFISEKDRDHIRTRFIETIQGNGGKVTEAEMLRRNGEMFPAFIQAIPVRKRGVVTGLRGIVIDLTNIRQEEKARRDLENKYRTLIDNAREIIIVSQDEKIKYINPLGQALTGYSEEELIGNPFSRFIHPDDRQLVYQNYLRRLESSDFRDDYVFRFLDRSGETHWVKTNAVKIEWDGKPATLNMLSEISDLIRTQKALSASESRLAEILDFLPDATFAVDREGRIIFWNQELIRLLNIPADEIRGKNKDTIAHYLYGENRPLLVDLLDHPDMEYPDNYLIQTRENDLLIGDIFITNLNGKPACLWAKAVHLFSHDDEITGAIESIRDITERKRVEEDLRTVNRKLNLLSSITRHDIRNQLSLILLSVDRILMLPAGEDVHEEAHRIDRTITRINDFIEIAREFQDIGTTEPEWKPVMKTLSAVITTMNVPVKTGGPHTICSHIQVYSDPLLEKVFYNIIDNAVRYATGFTAITCGCERRENGCILFIEDDGPGIPDEEKEQIFIKGYGKGSGLGLFLVREILGTTRMEIKETGEPGKGARFEIFIPRERFRFVRENQ